MVTDIGQASFKDLIREIARRTGVSEAPVETKRHGTHFELTIPVDEDSTAHLVMDSDTAELMDIRRTGKFDG